MSEPRTYPETGEQRQVREDRAAAALVAGLWRGCLAGAVVLTLVLAVFGGAAVGVVIALPILAIPVFLVQFACMVLAPCWLVRRPWRPPLLVLVSHLFSITIWTLLWSATEYGAAWRDVLGFLLLAHAVPVVLQAQQVISRMRRVARV
ncbi:MAG: hypothetical protein ACJA0V_004270 [Planctomycetota bacterium]|jgi:hypothetical protein